MFSKLPKLGFPFLLFLSLALHILYWFQFQKTPYAHLLFVDAKAYHLEALSLLDGGWLGSKVFYQSPLYPYFLALVYKLFGVHIPAVQMIQIIVSVANVILIALLGRELFDKKTAFLSGCLACFYGPFLFYSLLLLKATFSIFFTSLMLLVLLKGARSKKGWSFFLGGILLGVNILLRGNYFFLLPAILVWLLLSKRIRLALVFFAGTVLMISPVAIRNTVVAGDFVLTSYQGGIAFYVGNNPESAGLYTNFDFVDPSPKSEGEDFSRRAEILSGRSLKPSEVSRFWFKKGLEFIQKEPLSFLKLLLKKTFLFFSNEELGDNYDYPFMRSIVPVLNVGFLSFGVISFFAAFGLFLFRWRSDQGTVIYLFLAVYFVSVILFSVYARYRIPILPVLLPFAAYFLIQGWTKSSESRPVVRIGLAAVLLTVLAIMFRPHWNYNFARNHAQIGLAYEEEGNFKGAREEYQEALRIPPRFVEADILLGLLYKKEGQFAEAINQFQEAIKAYPDYLEAHLQLGVAYLEVGSLEEALRAFQNGIKVNPDSAKAWANLGWAHYSKGEMSHAISVTERALQLDPYLAEAHYNLGAFYNLTGDFEKSAYHYKEAKRLR